MRALEIDLRWLTGGKSTIVPDGIKMGGSRRWNPIANPPVSGSSNVESVKVGVSCCHTGGKKPMICRHHHPPPLNGVTSVCVPDIRWAVVKVAFFSSR